jgi:hypothetical protein
MAMNPRLLRPLATGFNPKSISGLDMWLDANDSASVTLDSAAVSEWKDKAKGSVFAQTTPNNRPTLTTINGKTALLFDGTTDTLSCVDPFTTFPLSMFFVQRIVAATNFGMTYTVGGSNDFNLRQNGTTGQLQIQMTSTAAGYSSTVLSTTVAQLISVVYQSTAENSVAYLNGTALTPTSGAFSQPTLSGTHFIGSRNASFHFNGYVGEILIYGKTVTATERAKIHQYLGKKWGITVA